MSERKIVTGYRFLDKDPIIDDYREAVRKSGMTRKEIEGHGGPKARTQLAWDKGDVRKPQSLSMASAMQIMGYLRAWINGETKDTIMTSRLKFPVPKK